MRKFPSVILATSQRVAKPGAIIVNIKHQIINRGHVSLPLSSGAMSVHANRGKYTSFRAALFLLGAANRYMKAEELADLVYGDDINGGPDWDISAVRGTITRLNRLLPVIGLRIGLYGPTGMQMVDLWDRAAVAASAVQELASGQIDLEGYLSTLPPEKPVLEAPRQ